MSDEPSGIPIYEVPADALRRPWVSRSFVLFIKARRRASDRHLMPAVVAATVTVLMHVALIGSLVWGAGRTRTVYPPERQGAGSSAVVSDQEPVMTLILINEPASQKTALPEENLASLGFAPGDLLVTLLSPDATPAFDFSDQSDPHQVLADIPDPIADSTTHALLFGRYVGQITARIERAWLRPRTPIGASSFACRVQIIQDRSGNVRQTTLQHCNGSMRWQLSLVQAIQSASPLPAPPDPHVFADAVTLEFDAAAYVPGGSAEGFEPQRLGDAANPAMDTGLGKFVQDLSRARSHDKGVSEVIDLRIVGKPSAGGPPQAPLSALDGAVAPAPEPPSPDLLPLP